MIGLMATVVLLVEKIAPLNNLDHIPTCNINRCCCKVGGEQRRLSFSFPDGRCVWAFSGRLEDPVDDHRVRVRLPVDKHRALPFPQ